MIAINVSKSSTMLFGKTGRRVPQPRPLRLFGEPIEWVDMVRYFGVTLDKRLTWSKPIDHVRKKAAQRLGILGPLLNRRISVSIRNGVLVYKQLIRPMMDYACPVWRSAAHSHIKKLQVLQSKCLRIATNSPWFIGNKQIHDDLGVPYFADHIRQLTERFDSKLADVGNPLVAQIGTYSQADGWPEPLTNVSVYLLPTLRFSSVLRQMPGCSSEGARPAHPTLFRLILKRLNNSGFDSQYAFQSKLFPQIGAL
jgi:hypothetical protein